MFIKILALLYSRHAKMTWKKKMKSIQNAKYYTIIFYKMTIAFKFNNPSIMQDQYFIAEFVQSYVISKYANSQILHIYSNLWSQKSSNFKPLVILCLTQNRLYQIKSPIELQIQIKLCILDDIVSHEIQNVYRLEQCHCKETHTSMDKRKKLKNAYMPRFLYEFLSYQFGSKRSKICIILLYRVSIF